MDPQIQELRKLVVENLQIAEDTRRVVHSMRRSQRVGRFFTLVWWFLVLVASGAAYYYYLQPYVAQIERLYENMQTNTQQAQQYQTQISNFLKNLIPKQ